MTSQSNTEIIEQIHHEFNTARLKLFSESQQFIENNKFKIDEDIEKAILLGFRGREILRYRNRKETFEKQKILFDLICDYKIKYPNNRFINHEEVEKIAKKYNLVIAPHERFLGSIPDFCLSKIVNFSLKQEDIANFEYSNKLTHHFKHITNIIEIEDRFSLEITKSNLKKDDKFSNEKLFIMVGTPDQFLIKSNEAVINNKIVQILKDDPICLKPVVGGYIILAMWGAEAELPEFKNNQLN